MTNSVRALWLLVALLPGALDVREGSALAMWVMWLVWSTVAVAVLVLHPLSLTAARFFSPALTLHAAWNVASSDEVNWAAVAGLAVLAISTILMFGSRYGTVHAQASAYGHERRHLLRPPVAVLLPLAVLWLLAVVAGAFAMYAASLPVAVAALVVWAALCYFTLRRALLLARRWLVFVPAGIAVHDPLVLRDTFMVRDHDVRELRASHNETQAFDATCTTWGSPLELVLAHPHDLSLSEFGARISDTLDRIHVTALLVAPSRAEQALQDRLARR
ncbi:MAG: hypothetical protein RL072_480 [Actinomycetota bacterium]